MLTRGRRTVQICSFLPSATEILYALDLGDSIAGVTFECDYPPQARQKRIKPELIVTQELCDVCAVSTSHLAKALHAVSPQPEVLSLTPHTLPDVFRDIEAVGAATGKQDRAAELVASLKQR